jgi:lysozyme family protein
MAAQSFSAALDEVLRHEGGYADHPLDPGGATNFGITQATLSAVRGRPVSKAEVMALRRETVAPIYRQRYWNVIRGDELPAGLDLALFDLAVNSGPGRAIKLLQGCLGVGADGALGPRTLEAVRSAVSADLINALCAARLTFLKRLATWPVFGRGWARRVAAIEQAARALGTNATPRAAAVTLPPRETPKELPMLMDTKSILASRTVWSNLIGLGAFALSFAGIDTGSIDQNALVNALLGAITGVSFIASTVFRITASHQLK